MIATSIREFDRATERLTLTVEEAITLIGCGRTAGYAEIRRTGALCGVHVVRVGCVCSSPVPHWSASYASQPPSDDAPCAA